MWLDLPAIRIHTGRGLSAAKISGFDPPLTTVWTAYPTDPLLAFLHPPIELPGG